MQCIEYCHLSGPYFGFHGHVLFKGEYLKNGAFQRQSCYGMLIGNHKQAIIGTSFNDLE